MVVVVGGLRAGVDRLNPTLREIKTIHPPVVIEYERSAVRRPVRRLEGISGVMNGFPVSGGDVEQLNVATDVITVRDKPFLRRTDQPDVPEDRLLRDAVVVGADVETDIDLVAQRDFAEALADQGLAKTGDRHRVDASDASELDDVGTVDRETLFLGRGALAAAELQ